ncbi:MAG: hypothetical protein K6C40_10915 [Thermoguttaceae bacterium]|nr:hypothetical protein [Thermoguttaceae bacterium]
MKKNPILNSLIVHRFGFFARNFEEKFENFWKKGKRVWSVELALRVTSLAERFHPLKAEGFSNSTLHPPNSTLKE